VLFSGGGLSGCQFHIEGHIVVGVSAGLGAADNDRGVVGGQWELIFTCVISLGRIDEEVQLRRNACA